MRYLYLGLGIVQSPVRPRKGSLHLFGHVLIEGSVVVWWDLWSGKPVEIEREGKREGERRKEKREVATRGQISEVETNGGLFLSGVVLCILCGGGGVLWSQPF